jgi:hypothetical protein
MQFRNDPTVSVVSDGGGKDDRTAGRAGQDRRRGAACALSLCWRDARCCGARVHGDDAGGLPHAVLRGARAWACLPVQSVSVRVAPRRSSAPRALTGVCAAQVAKIEQEAETNATKLR